MKKVTPKPRNVLARDLYQCPAFHMRTGPDKKRKTIAAKPNKQQLRAAAQG